MKNMTKILLAATVAVAFTSVNSAVAGDSPRAAANRPLMVSGTAENDPNLITNRAPGNAKAFALTSTSKVAGANNDVNLVSGSYDSAAIKAGLRK